MQTAVSSLGSNLDVLLLFAVEHVEDLVGVALFVEQVVPDGLRGRGEG